MLVDLFFVSFFQFYCLTESDDFAKAIFSLCIYGIFANFQNGLIFGISGVFKAVVCIE